MRIAEVIGRVTHVAAAPEPEGRDGSSIALPMPLEALTDGSPRRGEEVIAYDDLGAGPAA